MALETTDTPASSFVWGGGGAQLTPEQIAARRKAADAMIASGLDYQPIRSPWQGVAKVAQSLMGGYDYRQADQAERANAEANKQLIASLIGGGASPATVTPVATPPAAAAIVPAADTSGKIYKNDEPSPLDPPSGADRDALIRTVYGEAGNEPALGQQAVASVIRNRAVDGSYGGDTPLAVVKAPNQFEPWNGGPARDRMLALSPDDPKYQAISKVVDAAYGTGGRAPDDPTEGKTLFYAPAAQAALGRPAPAWATGDGQVIGGHTFYDDTEGAKPAKPVQVASAIPFAPQDAVAAVNGAAAVAPAAVTPAAPAVAKVAGALSGVNPAVLAAVTSPYASESTKKIAGLLLQAQLGKEKKDTYSEQKDADGNVWSVNNTTGQRTVALKSEKDAKKPTAIQEYEYYKAGLPPGEKPMDFGSWSDKKSRAAATNVVTNVDMNSGQTYDKQLAEGLGKSHAALANGVESAQARARDMAAMQGAVDAIQKNGGTTGGMGQQQILDLKKTINAGANAVGIETPFNENDISDKEFLTKFNRQIAGAQAKDAVGSRVTNFEMANYLKANPGLDMSITGNQRLIGIQSQIEQRNVAVGNAIRNATASAISQGKKIDPVTVQKIITDYDEGHHVKDPITGQDLTQSYALPEFQKPEMGTNSSLAIGHETNINGIKIKRVN